MITKYKKQIQPLIAIIAQPFLSWNPHILTILSVLFAVLFAVAFGLHLYILALLSWVGVIFDALDGYVARKSGKVTKFGAFFDSTVDRISDFLYISAFGFAGVIPWWLVSLALVTSFLISYTKARGEHVFPDVVITAGIMQRSERLLAVFIIFIAVLVKWSEIVLVLFYIFILLNTITVWQRISIVKKQL